MKKSNLKLYAAIALASLILFSSAFAMADVRQTIEVMFGKISVMVNGAPLDGETLLYGGTTYVPLRAVAEALGQEVTYDADTYTAYLDAPGTNRRLGAPDYALEENWAYLGVGGEQKDADLFLVGPTVFRGGENAFNMPLDEVNKPRLLKALNMERGLYEEHCRLFAPYYRQVGFNIYTMDAADAAPYHDIAYSDVRDAFKAYWEHHNDGRPFVLAGFSQGSDMALRLMKEFFDDEQVSEHCVAAYLIGWPVTEHDLDAYPFLKMAQGESDTGVIISFNTEAVDVTHSLVVPEGTLGINPLNWKTDSTPASRDENKGACFTNGDGEIDKEIPHLTGAYRDPARGTLKVPDIDPADYPPGLDLFGEGVYHIYDYQFFYRNLQENVAVRVQAFLASIRQRAA